MQAPSSRFWISAIVTAAAGYAVAASFTIANAQIAVRNQGYVPFSDEPINYRGDVDDPVARLQRRLDRGDTTLEWEPQQGYLKSVLAQLHVPVSSQALVFSKTSFQFRKISPATPRALYFNDDVYVGKVQDGKAIEIVSFDPRQGAVFYVLDEPRVERPVFQRAELDCTTCHVTPATRGVPGVLIRSIAPTSTGAQAARTPSFFTGSESPLAERFGGWYVTGSTAGQTHLGNLTAADDDRDDGRDRAPATDVTDLSKYFDTSAYLTPHSDIVAQLVQAHQTQMHNLITFTNYETRLALYDDAAKNRAAGLPEGTLSDEARSRYQRAADKLVRYLVFADEAPLAGAVSGTSGFTAEFAARGPRDSHGRSLRDFDLRTRLFKYPVSYLIYSDSFDALPEPAKSYVYHRLFEVLTGSDVPGDFSRINAESRRAAFDILRATKSGLPAEWKQGPHRSVAMAGAARRPTRLQ